MRRVRVGFSDLLVSQLCLGGMSFGDAAEWMVRGEEAKRIIEFAIDRGINFIDTANIYSHGKSEEIIGEVVKEYRDDVVISTKVGGKVSETHYGFSRKEIRNELRKSLRRIQTDYVDIYLLHIWFDHLDMLEVLRTLDALVNAGYIHYIGVSNFMGYQLAEFDTLARIYGLCRPVIVQNHYNAVYREDEREVIPYCRKHNISYSAFSPLAAGFLTGKYVRGVEPDSPRVRGYPVMKKRYFRDEDFDVLDVIKEIASEKDVKPAQIALAYVISKGFIPVFGATKLEHVSDAVEALDIKLSPDDIRRIEDKYKPHPVIKGTAGYY